MTSTEINDSDSLAAWVIEVYLVLHTLFLVGLALIVWLASGWPGFFEFAANPLAPDKFVLFQRLVISACAAGLGGGVFMIREFYIKFSYGRKNEGGKKEFLGRREIPRYVLLPFSFLVLGPISLALAKAGRVTCHLRRAAVLFAGFCVLAAPVALVQAAEDPVFLVKFGDTIDGKTLDVVAGTDVASHVSLNNRGDVAFLGYWDADNDGFPEQRGIFTPERLIVATGMTVGGHVLAAMGSPSINESGTVAFVATWDDDGDGWGDGTGIFTQHQLVAAEGQTIAGVRVGRLSGFDFPIVNDAGEVAFYVELNESPDPFCTATSFCPGALMTQDRVIVREGASIGGYDVRVLRAEAFKWPVYDFNAVGESAVIALTDPDGEEALLTGSQWIHRTGQTIGGRTLMALDAPSMNDLGQIAVAAGFGDPASGIIDHSAVLDRNGVVVEDGDVIDGFVLDMIGSVAALNNLGEIVFSARYRDGAVLRMGWFTQHRFLTPMDVTIDGIEVFLLGLPKINDASDVVLFAAWDANGDGDPRLEGSGIVLIANNRVIGIIMDIKPGSERNPINLKSNDVISVAILTTDHFDATSVDPLSVRFGPDGAKEVHGKGHIEDVDKDGAADLILHFKIQETGIARSDNEACLTGKTFDGDDIEGCDAIT